MLLSYVYILRSVPVLTCIILARLGVAESQTSCNYTHPLNLTITIQSDGYSEQIGWYVMKDSYTNTPAIIISAPGSHDQNELKSESVCNEYGCYWMRIEDLYEANGICCDRGNGWYDLKLNNHSILWMDKRQTFEDDFDEIYFCSDLLIGQPQVLNNLTIVIDYDTQVKIENVSVVPPIYETSPEPMDTITISEVVYDYRIDVENIFYESNNFSLFINDGCYQITMYQETSDGTESQEKHGEYCIYLNGEMRAIGGYYGDSESNFICTHEKHISSCIYPHHCDNREDVFLSNAEVFDSTQTYAISATSYGYLDNTTIVSPDYSPFAMDFNGKSLNCDGAYSCTNITLWFVEDGISNLLHCNGYFSCINIFTRSFMFGVTNVAGESRVYYAM